MHEMQRKIEKNLFAKVRGVLIGHWTEHISAASKTFCLSDKKKYQYQLMPTAAGGTAIIHDTDVLYDKQSIALRNSRQGQIGNKCQIATNKLADCQVNTKARSRFNLKLARKTALASCLLAATSIALAQSAPQVVESAALTPVPTAQAIALGNKLVDIAWMIVNTIPLTDATAIYRQFGIRNIRAGFRSDHVVVSPATQTNFSTPGLTSITLIPFNRQVSSGADIDNNSTSDANRSSLSINLNQTEACVTVDRVRLVFGDSFVVSRPRLVAPSCLTPGLTCIAPKPRIHEYAGIYYKNAKFFDGNEGGINFSFEYQQCSDTISIGSRSPE